MTGLAFAVEWLFVGWARSSLRGLLKHSASSRRDLWCFLFDVTSVWLFLGNLLTLGVLTWLVRRIQFEPIAPAMSVWVWIPIYFLVTDFAFYLLHRALHRFPSLWALHKYHHSATEFTALTARRLHPVESALSSFTFVIGGALVGVPTEGLFLFTSLDFCRSLLIHSNLQSTWGSVGRWLLISPAAHHIHHSADRKHYDRNFGGIFCIWDRLFGTWSEPAFAKVISIGVADEVFNRRTMAEEIVFALKESGRSLFASVFQYRGKRG